MTNIAVVIPTRNRPEKLKRLLESISNSTILPKQVVIVASGIDVQKITDNFANVFDITYLYSEVAGQIAQKRIGISSLRKDIDWCMFSDDDLLIGSHAIHNALVESIKFEEIKNKRIVGIGFYLPPNSRSLEFSKFMKRLAIIFQLGSRYPGKVLRSGHATSYLQNEYVTETQWLNGASMWRAEYAREYGKNLVSIPYAACEDLIFSYPLRKKGVLIFVPSAKLDFQDREFSNFNSIEVMKTASLMRYYFVSTNKEMSTLAFCWSQIFRTFFAFKEAKTQNPKLFLQLFSINLRIFKNILLRREPKDLIYDQLCGKD